MGGWGAWVGMVVLIVSSWQARLTAETTVRSVSKLSLWRWQAVGRTEDLIDQGCEGQWNTPEPQSSPPMSCSWQLQWIEDGSWTSPCPSGAQDPRRRPGRYYKLDIRCHTSSSLGRFVLPLLSTTIFR